VKSIIRQTGGGSKREGRIASGETLQGGYRLKIWPVKRMFFSQLYSWLWNEEGATEK